MHHALRVVPLLLATAAFATVRDELAPILDLSPMDTVARIRSAGETSIELELRSPQGARVQTLSVSTTSHSRILSAAREEGVFDSAKSEASAPTPPTPNSTDPDQTAGNRALFNRMQGSMGAGVIYWTVGFGLQPNSSSAALGLILMGYPASYFGHFMYSRDKEWTEAHVAGTNYVSSNLYFTSLLGLGFLGGSDENSWRLASFVSAAAYPVGIGVGYKYGQRLRDNPGRIYLCQALANQGAFTGALLPPTLISSDDMEASDARNLVRLSVLTSIGGEIGGHILGNRLFQGEHIPGGVGLGVSTLANLGLATSVEFVLDGDTDPRGVMGVLLVGNTLGTVAGLKFLPERRDTRERSLYISGGTSLGILGGFGMFLLSEPDDPSVKDVYTWPLLGAWAGYGIATAISTKMVEPARGKKAATNRSPIGDIAFSPLVIPVPDDGKTRWVWPGLTISLL